MSAPRSHLFLSLTKRPPHEQVLSLRNGLARLYSSLALLSRGLPAPPPTYRQTILDPIGSDPQSIEARPERAIVVGAAAGNPAMVSLLSTILGAPAYVPVESRAREQGFGERTTKTTSSALGAGYKACWGYARTKGETVPFAEFVRRRKESGLKREGETSQGGMSDSERGRKVQPSLRLGGSRVGWGAAASPIPQAPPPARTIDGLTLVARPDPYEFRYYGSSAYRILTFRRGRSTYVYRSLPVLRELLRLEGHLARGFI